MVVALGLFYTPIVQKKFFESGSGHLSEAFQGDYAGAGRFEAWPAIWDEAWSHPKLGAGVGSAYDFVPLVWEDINHVHNDYLRVFSKWNPRRNHFRLRHGVAVGRALSPHANDVRPDTLGLCGSLAGLVRSAY